MAQDVNAMGATTAEGVASTSPVGWFEPLFLALSVVGIGISSYLTWTHFSNTSIICTSDHSCDTVNHSAYAYFPPIDGGGIPVSVLGLVGYLLLAGLVAWRWQSVRQAQPTGRQDMALFLITLGGVAFSAYLTAMELWVIHAICWWCVGSASVMLILFGLAIWRIWNTEPV